MKKSDVHAQAKGSGFGGRERGISDSTASESKLARKSEELCSYKGSYSLHTLRLSCTTTLHILPNNLSKLAAITLSIPVATASVEKTFSQMKLIKTRLRSTLKDSSLSLPRENCD